SHANFCAPGKKRRQNCGHDLGGHHEHEPIGHPHQLAPGYDVGLALRIVRADELIAQLTIAGEVGSPRLFSEKRIRPSFNQAAVDAVGDEYTTEARTRLEQNVLDVCARLALLFDRKRGREAGDSAADDGYAFHGVSSWLLASSSWRLLSPYVFDQKFFTWNMSASLRCSIIALCNTRRSTIC